MKAKKKCILSVKYVSVTLFSEIFFMLQMRQYFNFWRSQSLGVHIGLPVLGYLKILGGVALKVCQISRFAKPGRGRGDGAFGINT